MNKAAVIVDVARSGSQTSLDSAHSSSMRVIASDTRGDGRHPGTARPHRLRRQEVRSRPCRDWNGHGLQIAIHGRGSAKDRAARSESNALRRALARERFRHSTVNDAELGLDELAIVHRRNGAAGSLRRCNPQDPGQKRAARGTRCSRLRPDQTASAQNKASSSHQGAGRKSQLGRPIDNKSIHLARRIISTA